MLLAVDAGTSGLRAAAFDASGACVADAESRYDLRHVDGRGVEQDAATWIGALERALGGLPREVTGRADALAVTSQRATIVPVDADGVPLHPAISWRDKRSEPQCRWLAEHIGEAAVHGRTGLRIDPYFSLPKILWLRDERPTAFRRARRLLTVHDLLLHHLTGRFVTDWTQASRTMLFDVDRLRWDEEIVEATGLHIDLLPEAVPPGAPAGALVTEVARRTGLAAGLPVIAAGGDQQAAAVGLGVVAAGQAEVTTGSGAFVLAPVDRPRRDDRGQLLCSPAAVAGTWILEGSVLTAMSAYRWIRREIAGQADTPADIEEVLGASPPGARGVIALPRLAGTAAPDWNPTARGVLFNIGLEHSCCDLGRAFLEGIVLDVARCLDVMHELVDSPLTEVVVSGSASGSDRFNQLQADMLGLPISPARGIHATALGAAILAAAAVGAQPDVGASVAAMTARDPVRLRVPEPLLGPVYERLATVRETLHATLAEAGLYGQVADPAPRR